MTSRTYAEITAMSLDSISLSVVRDGDPIEFAGVIQDSRIVGTATVSGKSGPLTLTQVHELVQSNQKALPPPTDVASEEAPPSIPPATG